MAGLLRGAAVVLVPSVGVDVFPFSALEAMAAGVPIEGVCLYPVTDYPGWDNERHCPVGLFSQPDAAGARKIAANLADELRRQQALFR